MVSGGADQQVVVELVAKTEKLEKGFKRAEKTTKNVGASIAKGFAIAAAAIAAVTVVLKKLTKAFTEYTLKIDKAVKVTGMSAKALQKWGYVAKQEHGNFEAVIKAFTMLSQRMVDAEQGLETYAREFREMGVDLRDEQGNLRSVNDVFMDMGDYVKNATNQTEAMGHMGKLLGARYVKDLMPMLKLTREEIERLGLEAEDLGIVLDENTIKAAKRFDDQMTKLKERFRGLGLQLIEKILPSLEKLVQEFDKTGPALSELITNIAELTKVFLDLVVNNSGAILWFISTLIKGLNEIALVAQTAADALDRVTLGKEAAAAKREGRAWSPTVAAAKRAEPETLRRWMKENRAEIREHEQWLREHPSATEKTVKNLQAEIAIARKRNEIYREEIKSKEKIAALDLGITPPPGAPLTGEGEAVKEKARELGARSVWLLATLGYHLKVAEHGIGKLEESFSELETVAAEALQIIENRLRAWANITREIFGGPIRKAFKDAFGFLKLQLKETEGVFVGFLKNLWNSLMDFAAKVLANSLIQLAVKLVSMLVSPASAAATIGIKDIIFKALGFDNPWNDAMMQRQGRDIVRHLVTGMQGALEPAFAGGGRSARTIVVRLPDPIGAFAEVYEETDPDSQQRFGRATRKAVGRDKEAD